MVAPDGTGCGALLYAPGWFALLTSPVTCGTDQAEGTVLMNSIQALMGSSFQPPSPAGSRGGRNLTEEEGLVPGPPPSLADAALR